MPAIPASPTATNALMVSTASSTPLTMNTPTNLLGAGVSVTGSGHSVAFQVFSDSTNNPQCALSLTVDGTAVLSGGTGGEQGVVTVLTSGTRTVQLTVTALTTGITINSATVYAVDLGM